MTKPNRPVLFFSYRGVDIFHVHKEGLGKGRILDYWFSTSEHSQGFEFDLRNYGVCEHYLHPATTTGGVPKSFTTTAGYESHYVMGGEPIEAWQDVYQIIQMATIKRLIDQGEITSSAWIEELLQPVSDADLLAAREREAAEFRDVLAELLT